MRAPVAVALDSDPVAARALAAAVGPHVAYLKVGLELFAHAGPAAADLVGRAGGARLFLDLKLHDIPTTVARAVAALAPVGPALLTVHASGGAAMVRAAVDAAGEHSPGTQIVGVTVLTSLGEPDIAAVGLAGPVAAAARRLGALAVAAGATALVCSPVEVAALRAEVGPEVLLITPGVRFALADRHDQARVATPEQALADGADVLVIGRTLTGAPDPGAAAAALARSLGA